MGFKLVIFHLLSLLREISLTNKVVWYYRLVPPDFKLFFVMFFLNQTIKSLLKAISSSLKFIASPKGEANYRIRRKKSHVTMSVCCGSRRCYRHLVVIRLDGHQHLTITMAWRVPPAVTSR
jgi:hypothetical protein